MGGVYYIYNCVLYLANYSIDNLFKITDLSHVHVLLINVTKNIKKTFVVVVEDWAKKSTGTCSRNEERCTLKKAGGRKEKQVSGKELFSFKILLRYI